MANKTVGIIGLGNLGSAMAHLLGMNGAEVIAWDFNPAVVSELNQLHTNQQFLADIRLTSNVTACDDLAQMLRQVSTVFITLPSRFIPQVLEPVQDLVNTELSRQLSWVNMSKGLYAESGKTSFQVLSEILPSSPKAMLSGPSLANEFAHQVPTAVVVASEHDGLCREVEALLNNGYFSVVSSEDVIGVELGGIVKNIYAMGLGLFQGKQQQGLNFIGAYLTQAQSEIKTFGLAHGAQTSSFDGLSGMGDLVATALSDQSHNFKFGQMLGQGLTLKQIEEKVAVFPEGYNALRVVMCIAREKYIQLPLAVIIEQAVDGERTISESLEAFSKVLREGI